MIVDDGGMVCFAIGDYLDGYRQEGQGHGAASPLRHVRPAHRRKGLVRVIAADRAMQAQGERPVLRLIATRAALGVLTLLAVSVLIFICTQILPGDVASAVLGQQATPDSLEGVSRRARARPARLCQIFALAVRRAAWRFRPSLDQPARHHRGALAAIRQHAVPRRLCRAHRRAARGRPRHSRGDPRGAAHRSAREYPHA